jgi:hypothetical protein
MATKDITDKLVCLAYLRARDVNMAQFPYDFLQEWTGEPFKVCYRAMERAHDRDLIEYGVSLRTGWVKSAGIALLKDDTKSFIANNSTRNP